MKIFHWTVDCCSTNPLNIDCVQLTGLAFLRPVSNAVTWSSMWFWNLNLILVFVNRNSNHGYSSVVLAMKVSRITNKQTEDKAWNASSEWLWLHCSCLAKQTNWMDDKWMWVDCLRNLFLKLIQVDAVAL
jgi:hypothetical protein